MLQKLSWFPFSHPQRMFDCSRTYDKVISCLTKVLLSGFCHFGLVSFMVLWPSHETPVMSCFYVSVGLRVCSSCALSRLRALFHVVAWCSDPRTHVFSFVSGFRTLALHVLFRCVSARSRVRSASRSSVHVCFVLWHAVRVFICCVHSCYVLCHVASSLCFSLAMCFHVVMSCVNTWLMSILISCVFTSCFAHGWWFVCWPCVCVFCSCSWSSSCLALLCFSPTGSFSLFVCFVLFLINKAHNSTVLSPRLIPSSPTCQGITWIQSQVQLKCLLRSRNTKLGR